MFEAQLNEGASLHVLQMENTEALFNLVDMERARLRQTLQWVDFTKSAADVGKFIEGGLEQYADRKGMHCAISEGAQIVGVAGINGINWRYLSCDFGYWIASAYEGKGLVTCAVQMLMRHAFADLKLHRVEIECRPDNLRSRAIPERLGFTYEGTRREAQDVGGERFDLMMYGLLVHEWRAKQIQPDRY